MELIKGRLRGGASYPGLRGLWRQSCHFITSSASIKKRGDLD